MELPEIIIIVDPFNARQDTKAKLLKKTNTDQYTCTSHSHTLH